MVFLPETLTLSNHKKNIREIPKEGHPTKYMTNTHISARVIKNNESLRHCHSQEELKETW